MLFGESQAFRVNDDDDDDDNHHHHHHHLYLYNAILGGSIALYNTFDINQQKRRT